MEVQKLHPLQEKLLRLTQSRNLSGLSLREVGQLVGDRSPQKIKHHLQQLEKRGLISLDRAHGTMQTPKQDWIDGFIKGKRLLRIPIVGAANCGPAELIAEENVLGYLRISSTLLKRQTSRGLFAIRADGFSMNRAEVRGKTIENGDYVIVDGENRSPTEGDVILSIIDGAANVKRFHRDPQHHQIVLLSDSTEDFAPIYIHGSDEFLVNGVVVDVLKRLTIK